MVGCSAIVVIVVVIAVVIDVVIVVIAFIVLVLVPKIAAVRGLAIPFIVVVIIATSVVMLTWGHPHAKATELLAIAIAVGGNDDGKG